MSIDQKDKRKALVRAYQSLENAGKMTDAGEYLGLWGYLKKRRALIKSQRLPNEYKGIVTCSKEEYMQLWAKTQRKKSNTLKLPALVDTILDLSIDLSKERLELPNIQKSSKKSLESLNINNAKDTDKEIDIHDLRLDGQTINTDLAKKHRRRKKNVDQTKSPKSKKKHHHKSKKEDLKGDPQQMDTKTLYFSYSPDINNDVDVMESMKVISPTDIPPAVDADAYPLPLCEQEEVVRDTALSTNDTGISTLTVKNSSRRNSLLHHGTESAKGKNLQLVVPEHLISSRKDSTNIDNNILGAFEDSPLESNIQISIRRDSAVQAQSGDRRGSSITSRVAKPSRLLESLEKRRGSRLEAEIGQTKGRESHKQLDVSRRNSISMNAGRRELMSAQGRRKSVKEDDILKQRRKSYKEETLMASRRKSMKIQEAVIESIDGSSSSGCMDSKLIINEPMPILKPTLGSEKIRELWKWAFYSIISRNGAFQGRITSSEDTFVCSQEIIKSFTKIENLYKKKKEFLSHTDFEDIHKILHKFSAFSKFPRDICIELLKECHFVIYPKGKRLIREGDQAEYCYTLLMGECIQFSETSNLKINQYGCCVGEFLSLTSLEPRNFNANCLTLCSFLYITKSAWIKYSREAKQFEAYKFEALSDINFFKTIGKTELAKISSKGSIRYFNPTTFILKDGKESENYYFIIKGKVSLLNLFEFVKCSDPFNDRLYTISPYNGTSNTNDEIVSELGIMCELIPGNFFPPVNSTPSLNKSNFNPWAYLTGDNTVETFVISKTDFNDVVPQSLLEDFENVNYFPTKETLILAQDRYLFNHGWCSNSQDNKISDRILHEFFRLKVNYESFLKRGQNSTE